MSCEDVVRRLNEYVDGGLGAAETGELRHHLETCARCAKEEADLRRLIAAARALPEPAGPRRDLWPAIERQIARRRVVPFPTARRSWTRPASLLAAAAALVAVTSVVTLRLSRPEPGSPAVAGAPRSAGATLLPAAARSASESPGDAERQYADAANELLRLIEAKRSQLSPETLEIVEQNMKAVDDAIANIRQALAADPGNRDLAQTLASTQRVKVDTLRRVVRLSKI